MFAQEDVTQHDCLRQGDILEGIPFPLLDSKALLVLGKYEPSQQQEAFPAISPAFQSHREDPYFFTGQLKMRKSFCAVLSHCCELEPRHNKLFSAAISLARLIPIKSSIVQDTAKLASLRENRNPLSGVPGYIDYFYINAHERLVNREWMVDFSQVLSIPNSEFPEILARKILQLDDRTRARFKIKLATYYGRFTDEEVSAGLRHPWQ